MILLDVPAAQVEATLQRLEQFLFSEDVQLASLAGTLRGVWLHGPGRRQYSIACSPARRLRHGRVSEQPVQFAGTPVVVARIDQLGVPGFCAYLAPEHADAFVTALVAAAQWPVSEAIDALRIEAGYPLFGVDMTEDTIPLEAGIEDARDLVDEGLLRRPGSHHSRAAPRRRPRRQEAGRTSRRRQRPRHVVRASSRVSGRSAS